MSLYQISATLGAPGRDDSLKSEIQKSADCWAISGSVWLISTGETIDELRARLTRVAHGVPLVIKPVAAAGERPPASDLWAWLNHHT